MGVIQSRFNWIQSPSMWQDTQMQRAKWAAARADYESFQSTISGNFSTAIGDQVSGAANLAIQQAATRIQKNMNARIAALRVAAGGVKTA